MSTTIVGGRGDARTNKGTRGLLHALLTTNEDRVALTLRSTLALVMFPHGAQKLLGWFGGPGFSGAMGHLTVDYGLPWLIALAVVLIEFFAPLALLLGLLSRVAALAIAVVMLGAAVTTHLPNGFFMNWFGNQAGEGYEYHLLAIGLAVAVIAHGSGAFSLDRRLARRLRRRYDAATDVRETRLPPRSAAAGA